MSQIEDEKELLDGIEENAPREENNSMIYDEEEEVLENESENQNDAESFKN